CPSDVVLDAGTGSGVLAIYLGTIAKKVISYEVNEQFVEVARKNVARAGLSNVEVRHGDVLKELYEADIGAEGPFDVVTLDMQGSDEAAGGAHDVLKPGGFLATYSPFFEQAASTRRAIERAGFPEYDTIILGEQELEVGKRGTRPSTRVGHTGFITIARK
ncbi:MAG TPA: methyltransferase domain-containing protein, partial [Methanocella sp.]|nr:methyltransferase domain-containing protein [Methanocella sp.]